jgi:hypothetical protein
LTDVATSSDTFLTSPAQLRFKTSQGILIRGRTVHFSWIGIVVASSFAWPALAWRRLMARRASWFQLRQPFS